MNGMVAILKHDRWIVGGALVLVTLGSWAYLLTGAGISMTPADKLWSPGYFLAMLLMWCVMMVAMMLPSAAPMILTFAAIGRKQTKFGARNLALVLFTSGYLIVWCGFSLGAVFLQWALQRAGYPSMMLADNAPLLSGALLIAAGLWQLTPIKQQCLRHCQSPVKFLILRYRPGLPAALKMGCQHGLFCLGCCWFLMLLLFYGGVMNIAWIGGLALFVLVEKLTPPGHWVTKTTGWLLITWGVIWSATGIHLVS